MVDYDLVVNGTSHKVSVKNQSIDLKLKRQREIVSNLKNFFNRHPAIFIAMVSAYLSLSGFISLWIVFSKEDINLFDYVSPIDFFFGVFAVSTGPLVILVVFIILAIGFFSYYKQVWTTPYTFWWFVVLYLIIAPMTAPYFIYEPVQLCSKEQDRYEVTYKVPGTAKESDLILIASLSDYKVFKKEHPDCDSKFVDSDISRAEVVAINDSAIAKMTRIAQ